MALPTPIDPPLTVNSYDVHSSEADLFYWHASLIRPIPPDDDPVEAQVRYETDEFGFPNAAPLPETVDVVVLGRSYSMGAQANDPWPRRLAEKSGLKVLNLSQAGAGIDTKAGYLQNFGLPRHPRWVILEVLPSFDVVGLGQPQSWLVAELPLPVLQYYARRALNVDANQIGVTGSEAAARFYPLAVDIPKGSAQLVFYDFYLASLTVDRKSLEQSSQWQDYTEQVLSLTSEARAGGACMALLFAPTRENIYFALAAQPNQLQPVLTGWQGWTLDATNRLVADGSSSPDIIQMRLNAFAARDLVADFASLHGMSFIDPSLAMLKAAATGNPPFMAYDSHWSALGHRLVAEAVEETLSQTACP